FIRKNADGSYSNGSGCGNETASERPLMRQYMIESAQYWVNEYHIDGFRFDLMGVHDIATMNAIRKALPDDVFIYGEGWSAGGCAIPNERLGMKSNVAQMPGIAAFSDDMRDGLRGPWDGDDKAAFLGRVKGNEESIKFGLVGGVAHPQVDLKKVNYSDVNWAVQPTQMIAYVSCHDDMCLVDRLKASIPGITTDEIIRLDLLAQTAVMTSQGVPFMLSGEEMLRTKKGVHNSYNSPDSINHLDWNNLKRYPQVMEYYSRLIAMRKHHPAFHMGDAQQVRDHLEFLPGGDCLVAFVLRNHAGGDTWNDIYVAFNANRESRTITVPAGKYTVVCSGGMIDEKELGTIDGGKVIVPAQSALIIHN
ncbi:MAG: type I pullulanase, partial [Muribaculaceae bacterium]|nr:type I pullulanase [Muribaculaceae bacterium]